MPNITPTIQTLKLVHALEEQGITVETEHYDGHKHVDICISDARMYIEVDGLKHYTNADQILSDFVREYYSNKDGISTLHIPNEYIDTHLYQIAAAITRVVKKEEVEI